MKFQYFNTIIKVLKKTKGDNYMILSFNHKTPSIHKTCFIAENSTVIGAVTIEEYSSIWYNTVIRADVNNIYIGKGTNIQDNCTLHVNYKSPLSIGEYVTVGHNAILHGCTIGNKVLIGMGSIIMDDVEIGDNTIIGAGSLVPPGKTIPSGVLCLGSPAKIIRQLNPNEINDLSLSAKNYIEAAFTYKSNQ